LFWQLVCVHSVGWATIVTGHKVLSGGFGGRGRAGSSPPFGWRTGCSTVKHALQNTQNDCHQWLSQSFRVHQIRFRPRPCGASLKHSPNPLAGISGGIILLKRRGGRGDGPLTQIPGFTPGTALGCVRRSVCFHCNIWTKWLLTLIFCICIDHDCNLPGLSKVKG